MAGTESYPPAQWRLLTDGEADGATNMAVDEAILSAVADGSSFPTLRFYAWAPPCLSLGRNQPITDVDLEACRAAGVDVVRRPTGGRAILHTDELTYSAALVQGDPRVAGDLLTGYRSLSKGLLAGLRMLGADVTQALGQHHRVTEVSAVCFETPSDYEITSGGRKLVGSAQWRAKGGVLQHGTLPLVGDVARIVHYLSIPEAACAPHSLAVHARALTLEEALGRPVPFAAVAQALALGLAEALNLTYVRGELSLQEREMAADLRRSRYGRLSWTERT